MSPASYKKYRERGDRHIIWNFYKFLPGFAYVLERLLIVMTTKEKGKRESNRKELGITRGSDDGRKEEK